MSNNRLLERLKKKDKKGVFNPSTSDISYVSGFAPLDFRNGYMMQCFDDNDDVVGQYPSLGFVGGSMITLIGKSATAKTTLGIQIGANIIRQFQDGMMIHYDLETATSYSRVKSVTGFKQTELGQKYILKRDQGYIEDITEAIVEICHMKECHKDEFMYDTGLKDEFNNDIRHFIPTVILIDSIPSLRSRPDVVTDKETKAKLEQVEVGNSMARNRDVQKISNMYANLMGMIRKYNVTIITVNHIKKKIETNMFAKTQAQIMWLKPDESLPGGDASVYYANNILKNVSIGGTKATKEEDGYDGFSIRCELVKSRTNKAGQSCVLVYDQAKGFDPALTLLEFAREQGLIGGARKNSRYFVGHEDIKFNEKDFANEFVTRQDVRFAAHDVTIPVLQSQLSKVDGDEIAKMNESMSNLPTLKIDEEADLGMED